jgi:hypothetical protein
MPQVNQIVEWKAAWFWSKWSMQLSKAIIAGCDPQKLAQWPIADRTGSSTIRVSIAIWSRGIGHGALWFWKEFDRPGDGVWRSGFLKHWPFLRAWISYFGRWSSHTNAFDWHQPDKCHTYVWASAHMRILTWLRNWLIIRLGRMRRMLPPAINQPCQVKHLSVGLKLVHFRSSSSTLCAAAITERCLLSLSP